jgi:hypothetical protein
MKRTLVFLATIAAVIAVSLFQTGCAQIESKIASDVQPIVHADLQAAIAVAQTRPATEQQTLACYQGLDAWAAALPTTAPPLADPGQVKGLISAAEVARLAVLDASTPAPALPPLDIVTYNACLVAFADTKLAAIKLSAVLAGLAKGGGLAHAAVGLKGQAAALKAAEAALGAH